MFFDFNNKTVLVTGAGAGIGAAVADAFYQAGAQVILNSVSGSAKTVVEEILAKSSITDRKNAVFIQADVSSPRQVKSMVEQTSEIFGGIDVVVNCAGIVTSGNVEETEVEVWNQTMAVNATGIFLVCKYALPYLRQSKGVIVNVSSLVAVKGIANRAAYSASKGAVLSLSKAMAADYIGDGIRVNCVCPGTVLSPSLEARIAAEPDPEDTYKHYVSRQAMGRLGMPEEIAAAVLFAASSEVGFMNGTNIMVDGAASL
ncbi:MAG: SDR family oxidoreductase [Lachnospiraceae bacterium]|nr:SDR family oxidoreductase [Lachnospiraceae bacterium]